MLGRDFSKAGTTMTDAERASAAQSAIIGWASIGFAAAATPVLPVASEQGLVSDLLYGGRPGQGLPGRGGVSIASRPTVSELENLTNKHGVEFAVTYKLGPGRNGGGGQYFLHSGDISSVPIPLEPDRMFIYHTHPGGTPWASGPDMKVMEHLQKIGSPQRSSQVIPVGTGKPVQFSATRSR